MLARLVMWGSSAQGREAGGDGSPIRARTAVVATIVSGLQLASPQVHQAHRQARRRNCCGITAADIT